MLIIRKIIATTSNKVIVEVQADTASELVTSTEQYIFADGSLAWVIQTGAFYGLSGGTWYNQDGSGAYSPGG